MVPLSEATRDDRQLYEWWSSEEFKDCNPGILLGRIAGVFALRIEDRAALGRLWDMAAYEVHDVDNDKRWTEWREFGGASVRLMAPSQPVSVRSRMGWGRSFTRAIAAEMKEQREHLPQTAWILYSYHPVVSGLDCWEFVSRKVLPGVTLLGEGEVLPFDGAVLDGGVRVSGIAQSPPEVPLWLAKVVGKPRSRRVVAAAREAHEATLRMVNARAIAAEAQLRILEDEARAKAEADRAKAEAILAEVMGK
jgi:hypothetical protein